jgi:hypothetical protein
MAQTTDVARDLREVADAANKRLPDANEQGCKNTLIGRKEALANP